MTCSVLRRNAEERPVRGRWPIGCGRARSTRWWGRTTCSAPTARCHADAGARVARLADPVGSARLRQDHHRPAAGSTFRTAFRAALGGVLRRRRPEARVRRGGAAAPDRAGDAAVRRRDPPLQPRAAGRLPARSRGRHGHADRRHHREPVVRAERRAAVALPGAGAAPARRRGAGAAACARGSRYRPRAAARCAKRAPLCAPWPTATAAMCSTWPSRSSLCPPRHR